MERRNKINSYLWVFLILLNTITLPFKLYFEDGLVVYISTILLVLIMLFNNKIKKHIIYFFSILSILFLLNALVFQLIHESLSIYVDTLKFGFLFYWFSTEQFNIEYLMKVYYKVNIFVTAILLFCIIKDGSSIGYMSLGNQITYCYIPFVYASNDDRFSHKLFNISMQFFLLIICAMYANRMSIVTLFLVLIFTDFYFLTKKINLSTILKYTVLIFLSLYINKNIVELVNRLINFLSGVGYHSYSLYKFERMLAGNVTITEFTSGRDYIYKDAINMIKESSFLPNGIGYFEFKTSISYPHNIFLDLGISFGFLLIPVSVFFIVYLYKVLIKKNFYYTYMILVFLIFSFSRLMVSSTIWIDSAFWISLGFMYRVLHIKSINTIN